ncbi:MAG: sugar phosphate nucleotidyltransferase [bacterium]
MNISGIIGNFGAVVLSAGQGTRLQCNDTPKTMLEIGGKPIVSYIVDTLYRLGFTKEKISLVVGFHKEKVMDFFGDKVTYAVQEEQLGTAHATYIGIKALPDEVDNILVMNGDDSAFFKSTTIENLINQHIEEQAMVSLLSTSIDSSSFAYGRIIRNGHEIDIIEKEYLTEENRHTTETSTGTFCFNRRWYKNMFPNMPIIEKLGEYGLPTAFMMAQKEGLSVRVVKLQDRREWFGVNTKEELEEADKRKKLFL